MHDVRSPVFTCLLFDPVHFILRKHKLCSADAEWDEFAKYLGHVDVLHAVFCSLLESVATVLGIWHQKSAAPRFVPHSAKSLHVPSMQSSEPPGVPALLKRAAFNIELCWADIGTHTLKKRFQTGHAVFKCKNRRINLSESESHCSITALNHSDERFEEQVININLLESYRYLPEVSMSA